MSCFLASYLVILFSTFQSVAQTKCPSSPVSPFALTEENKFNLGISSSDPQIQNRSIEGQVNGKKMNISYIRYKATVSPNKGTVLFLCGGPGYPCVNYRRPENIPRDYDVVTMDYFGVGQNRRYNQPNDMAIDSQAQAVAAVVKSMSDASVVLYGHSFGTAVATAAAAKLTSLDANDPTSKKLRAVIMEGVVGGQLDYATGFAKAADTAWNLLKPEEKSNFKSHYTEICSGLTQEQKLSINIDLTKKLAEGTDSTLKYLRTFNSFYPNAQYFADHKQDLQKLMGDQNMQLAAGCQILNPSVNNLKMFDGSVDVAALISPYFCDCATVTKKWNADEYQIKGVPVVYINGKQDPATPYDEAFKHSQNQTHTSQKIFLSSLFGGHSETNPGDPLGGCMTDILDSANSGDISKLIKNQQSMEKNNCAPTGNSLNSSSTGSF